MSGLPRGCCAVCGAPDAIGAGLCPACSGIAGADRLLFVNRPRSRLERAEMRERMGELLGERMRTPQGRAAALGERALLRLPARLGELSVHALAEHGIAARAVPADRAWSMMPGHFFLMLASILVVGGLAGIVAVPAYLWLSPALAGLLLLLAQRSMRNPLFLPGSAALASETEHALIDGLARLPVGRTRELLGDLARIARPLAEALDAEGDPGALRSTLDELVQAAAATALEVHRLEETLAVLADGDTGAEAGDEMREAVARCRAAADTGLRQLVEAVTSVTSIGGRTGLDTRSSSRLAELTRELNQAARHREEAIREVDRLLGRPAPA